VTTHELAGLLEHLRDGLGEALQKRTGDEFAEAAEAFRSLPDKSLKEFAKDVQKAASPAGGGVERLVERVRVCRAGGGESVDQVMKDVNKLKQAELQALLRAFGQNPGKNKVTENKAQIQRLLQTPAGAEPAAPATAHGAPDRQIDHGYRRMQELRDAPDLSIEGLRAEFAPIRQYPKAVLDGIARKLGYNFPGGKDEVADQLLQTLERMRISQLRGEVIKGAV
jgi:hypothetical protein